ncbi:bifunctional diguanylate cyclase/phosphodiesterase [Stutzerimonas urumqiensis]|uniref:putative bifunctional diguanylate cyclase/phosphodiesterase n=1 Tax=Stutzerimonas urumqiensis TaxID=638269 RepID=UPI003BAA370D
MSLKPLRVIVLAERCAAVDRLAEWLQAQPATASLVVSHERGEVAGRPEDTVVFATPSCRPARSELPTVLLLDREPDTLPSGIADWLLVDRLDDHNLRRCLHQLQERSRLLRTVTRLSAQDPLTGITNRQGFVARLAQRLDRSDSERLALGLLDLDNFRAANDTLGYLAGDRLIVQVVARLREVLEAGDELARVGGDEFALLIDAHNPPRRLDALADRIVETLAEPYHLDGESLLIGCSLGLAAADTDVRQDRLMWSAHVAMRRAKSRSGCTWHLYDERLDRSARSLADLEGELRRALRRDELELHYQPRLCLSDGRVAGIEALVRWPRRGGALLPPAEFIPLAEESGLIVPLGYWVIARALSDLQRLRAQGIAGLHLAINLSFRQFQDSQLLPTLERLIAERDVDPAWLEFELTETAVMRRSEQVRQTMLALEQRGVRFSLDDFGTGFSSFTHLKSLPVSLLKIDRSFVAGMDRPEGRRLVQAMITLGRSLDLQVVAEGVETAEQLGWLRRYGADQVQGYLIAKPLPLNALRDFLARPEGRRLDRLS